ncbi:MAG: hypothetical protein H6696_02245 [Deferribacteres bacterium]|nr:hypothetical protein [candidate division KSB1 bacterium]MCB9500734.1 hypothetical protein [Deferribacteres bacterium]
MSGLFLTLVSCSLLLASVETEISWNANAEPDLAGYRVHVGTASGNYSQIYDVGKYTGYSLTLDEPGVTYFFAVTAYDTAGNESSYSEEVTAIFGTEKDDDPIDDPTVDPTAYDTRVYNFPNPFIAGEQETHLRFMLEKSGPVTIEIFNVNNELVRTVENEAELDAGLHTEIVWNGRADTGDKVPQGVYFGRILTSNSIRIIKIAVVR